MSKLHLAQIQRHLEVHFLPRIDLAGASQEHHGLSRAVAALALAARTDLPESTVSKSVTDHPLDGGIDAIAYAADRSTLVFVQSKWTAEANTGVSHGDTLKFIRGVERIVENDWDGFGGPLLDRKNEIQDILFQPGTKLEVVIATTSTSALGEDQLRSLNDFCAKVNDSTEIASVVYLNQERLYSTVASAQNAQIDLSVNLRNWGSYEEGNIVAYYGTASAQEIVEWYHTHGDMLFSRNIRGALAGTDVNGAIIATAGSDPSQFWFFNNGITVIAESFEKTPHVNQKSGNFQFKRASVVNGAQTVSSLTFAAQQHPAVLEAADVFVRFVTLGDPDGEFGRLVTRRTNTQNRVGGREFVALDPEQERIRMEFAVSGLRYAYRSGEVVTDAATGCDLNDATIALACSLGINETVLAKREISRLWDDTSKTPYKALFNPSVSGSLVWIAVELMRWVDDAIKIIQVIHDGRDRLIVVHGNRLVLWAVMSNAKLRSTDLAGGFASPFDMKAIHKDTIEATRLLVEIVNERYPDSYPQPLFKNQAKCRTIGQELLRRLSEVDQVAV